MVDRHHHRNREERNRTEEDRHHHRGICHPHMVMVVHLLQLVHVVTCLRHHSLVVASLRLLCPVLLPLLPPLHLPLHQRMDLPHHHHRGRRHLSILIECVHLDYRIIIELRCSYELNPSATTSSSIVSTFLTERCNKQRSIQWRICLIEPPSAAVTLVHIDFEFGEFRIMLSNSNVCLIANIANLSLP